jgi:hypothetical protein
MLLVGCSTVERRTYYEPLGDRSKISGPAEPSCGWTNFGGVPDQYLATFADSPVKITANQGIQPYLFGPWFVSVVPVFPVTWLIEAFVKHELDVQLSSSKPVLRPLAAAQFVATVGSRKFSASSVDANEHFLRLVFPIEASEIEQFVLTVQMEGKSIIEVAFRRTARWAWTQWTPNC